MDKSLLVIGRPNSTKTAFITQLYNRLLVKAGDLILDKPVDDISPIKTSREALANGEEPQSTYGAKRQKLEVLAKYKDQIINLSCPDYGGEQIDKIISERQVDSAWKSAINGSESWLFFIRLTSIDHHPDLSTATIDKTVETKKTENESEYKISDQTAMLEALQIFLDVKGHDYHLKNEKVNLVIALTCWDELNTEDKPIEVLKKSLPLLFNFLESNWNKKRLKVWGLSAQGFSLNIPENAEKYQIYGPEKFGYVVDETGAQHDDLTKLVIAAL